MARSREGVVGDEHLVAIAHAEREKGQVQPRSAVVDGNGVGHPTTLGESLLEGAGARTLTGNPTRGERVVDGL